MFIEELRAQTMQDHQQLDKLLIPYIKGCDTTAKYADLLQCFYGYFHPLELLISTYINDNIVPQYSRRRKSNVIAEELQSMHENLRATNEDVPLPRIDNIAGALGAMYVLEALQWVARSSARFLQGISLSNHQTFVFSIITGTMRMLYGASLYKR